jgi:[NiFe] hydrogenase assembly HybE family chaperone
MTIKVADLVARYQAIYEERMRDLPIVNPKLAVEAVGFDQWEEKDLGILITPWFMNLVLLPDSDRLVDLPQGDRVECRFPSGPCELTVYQDEELGTYLAAVLFRTVADFPDQDVARAVAEEALAAYRTPGVLMHELSVCLSLLREVERIARENNAGRVTRISVTVGPLSGVEPDLLRNAYPLAVAGTVVQAPLPRMPSSRSMSRTLS